MANANFYSTVPHCFPVVLNIVSNIHIFKCVCNIYIDIDVFFFNQGIQHGS